MAGDDRGQRVLVNDPTGEIYGCGPVYRWGGAPDHLMTRRQLAAAGLRKGGADPVAEMRKWTKGWFVAYLYDSTICPQRRPWTPAKQRAVETAARAKTRCRDCGDPINPHTGDCGTCHAPQDLEIAA